MAIHNIILPDDDAITRRTIFVLNQKKKIKYNWIITGEIKEANEKLVFFNQHFRVDEKRKESQSQYLQTQYVWYLSNVRRCRRCGI